MTEPQPDADPSAVPLRQWLLFIYRVPQEPPGRRTYVWRQLKQLGAIYLQQAAAILPDQPSARLALEALAERIQAFEGEVSLLETTSPGKGWEQALQARFNQARDDEYAEIVENVERLEDEIRRETRKGRLTFAQLEDIEADFEKLQRWAERITKRDFFTAPGRATAEEALAQGAMALEAFAQSVYEHEGVQERSAVQQEPEYVPDLSEEES
jgi:hypothetical protein